MRPLAGQAFNPNTASGWLVPEALTLLNQGDRATHDALIAAEVEALAQGGAKSVVLAQVSMAHLGEPLSQRFGLPVLESLNTSLVTIKKALSHVG